MSRAAGGALSLLLAVLVAASVVLTGRLWLSDPFLIPPAPPATSYVAADAMGSARAVDVLAPARMVLFLDHGGDVRALSDPSDATYAALWSAALQVLRQLGPTVFRGGRSASRAELARALQTAPAALELVYGTRLPWGVWWTALGNGARSGKDGPFTSRVALIPNGAATRVFLGAGPRVWVLSVPGTAGRRLENELVAQHSGASGAGYALEPLVGGQSGIALEPGIYVPTPAFDPGTVAVAPELLDVRGLAAASFADPAAVRRILADDGSRFLTDGANWLRVSPAGAVRWSAPGDPTAVAPGPATAIAKAVDFVDEHGGWPTSPLLTAAMPEGGQGPFPLRGVGRPPGWHLAFTRRYRGLAILGSTPMVLVSVEGGDAVTAYARNALTPAPDSLPVVWEAPSKALAALGKNWPAVLAGSTRLVSDVFPCYVYIGGARLTPAWAFELDDGGRVFVDATSGQVLGPLSPMP